jgi:cobalt-zinc-cadmium resistance protein CzcA
VIAKLAAFAVQKRLFVLGFTLATSLVAGIFATRLPLDALPDLTNNQCIVLTTAPGLSPEEVELTVTRKVEVALSGLPSLVEQRSLSRYGISSVTAVFEDGLDPYRARQIVAERLATVALPPGIEAPQLAPLTGGLGEIFHLTLSSPRRTTAELLELATLRVGPLLKSVPGVVEVNTWGGALRTLDVAVKPSALATHGLTLDAVKLALENATGATPGGALPREGGQVLLRAKARPKSATELANAIVAQPNLRVGDVAVVRDGELLRLGAATADGGGETVYLMVQMLRDENALDVVSHIHRRLPELRKLLPDDVEVHTVYDRGVLVNKTLRTVGKNLLEGFALVSLVLLLFLGSVRAGLIAASVIPLSMAFATALMALFKLPGNLMSLGALDFGLLVDGAVVMVEGVFHGAQHARDKPWAGYVREVVERAARPVFFSVLVILLVYIPVLTMTGTDGKLFRPMAVTVVLALFFSLALSMTWVPAMLALVLDHDHVPKRDPLIVRLVERIYPPIVGAAQRRPWLVTVLALLLLGLGVRAGQTRGVEFTPELDEGDMVVQTTRDADISLETAVVEALKLERVLKAGVPEVLSVVSRIGSPAVATDIMGFEQADVFVALKPHAQHRPGLSHDALVEEMARVLAAGAPGGEPAFTQPIQMRFNELLGGAVTDVAVSVYGDDLLTLREVAEALAAEIKHVPGAHDVRVLAPPSVPLFDVRPQPLALAQRGLSARDVLDAVQALRMGLTVGETYDGALRIPIRLVLDARASAGDLGSMPLPLASGGAVPLASVADIALMDAPGLVNRRNGQRRLVVGFNVRGADLGSVVQGAQDAAEQRLKLPAGYRLEWGGQYENLAEAKARLAYIVPGVLVLIAIVLIATFGSARAATFVFSVVPVAAVGGVLALYAGDLPVSLPAMVGFIALSGIAVMNGVVWMARALELSEEAGVAGNTPREVAFQAASDRVRAVLMTALVAALGFLPMMLSQGDGAEVQRPLATVVVGGLFTSTLLTLVVLPALYPWFMGRARKASP